MEIELTSSREDGSWTWRAAGALQPRGVIPGSMVADHGRVGEVLRVEADFELDGITIVAVLPSKGRSREPERIEIIRPTPGSFQPVTTALVGKDDRRGRGRDHAARAVEGVQVLVRERLVGTESRESHRLATDRHASVSLERPKFERAHRQSAARHARHLRAAEGDLRRRPVQLDRRVPLDQNDPRGHVHHDSLSGPRTGMRCSRPIRRSSAR